MELNKIYRLLGLAARAGKIAFGTESVLENIENKKAKLIIVAEDASERTRTNVNKKAEKNEINVRSYGTIEKLSRSIGKENKAVIAIKDINFANEILKNIDGGEIIG